MLRRLGSPTERGTTTHERIPWGERQQNEWIIQQDISRRLEDADIPLNAGRPQIRAFLQANGLKLGNQQITELIDYRRALAGEAQLDFDT